MPLSTWCCGHDRPKRARAYLLTDQAVSETAAHYAGYRPELDAESRHAIIDAANAHPDQNENPAAESGSPDTGGSSGRQPSMAEQSLWMALTKLNS
jgi:S-DNA-T family DNA segregation ATPase FtsK/SpoIIIE